jgi:hypothetical protein
LAEALTLATTDKLMRQRAVDLGKNIRMENGIEKTVAIISRYL